MLKPRQDCFVEPAELLGLGHPLVEQLGSARGLVSLASVSDLLQAGPVTGVAALGQLMDQYRTEILLPIELPAIYRAYHHADRNQLRELIRFDRQLADEPRWRTFGGPSRRVGRIQLRRLRPLRDVRLVQRYLAAVQCEEANAWHTLVYGLTMSLFSLPLHQGLHGYARQIVRGFIRAAAPTLRLSDVECRHFSAQLESGLFRSVASVAASGKAS